MFSWICPQCGRDVPPSKTDCPYCDENARAAAEFAAAHPPNAAPANAEPQAPPQPQYQPPAYAQPPAPPQYQAPPPPPPPAPTYQNAYAPPPPNYQAPYPPNQAPPPPYGQPHPAAWHQPPARKAVPAWLMGVGFAVAFIVVLGGVYFGIQKFGTTPAQKAGVENPRNPSKQKVSNPLQKWVEVVGVRLVAENKKPTAQFVVVNHSGREINDMAASVTLWASDSRSEEDAVGTFKFSLPSLRSNEAKDLSSPLQTKMKMYELPDWQNMTAEITITSPAVP